MVTGLSWLLAGYLETTDDEAGDQGANPPSGGVNLDRLVTLMAYGSGVTVSLLLASTTYDYAKISFPASSKVPDRLGWMVLASPALVILASIIAQIAYRRRVAGIPVDRFSAATRFLRYSAYGVALYAVFAPIFAGVITQFGQFSWDASTSSLIVALSIGAGLVLPAILAVTMMLAVAPLARDSDRKGVQPVRHWRSGIRACFRSIRPLARRGLQSAMELMAHLYHMGEKLPESDHECSSSGSDQPGE